MKVLVLGGLGLIGSDIVTHLRGNHVVSIYDPKDLDSFNNLRGHYDAVIDCGRYPNLEDQRTIWEILIAGFPKDGGGKLILFSSIYGSKAPRFEMYPGTEIMPTPLQYAMWKAGTEQAVRYLAQKLKPLVQVNGIAPGGVIDLHSDAFQDAYRNAGGASMIEAKNLLPVVDMLLHPDNAVNGEVIRVDKGWTL